MLRTVIDNAFAPINIAVLPHLFKSIVDSFDNFIVEREYQIVPISAHANRPQL